MRVYTHGCSINTGHKEGGGRHVHPNVMFLPLKKVFTKVDAGSIWQEVSRNYGRMSRPIYLWIKEGGGQNFFWYTIYSVRTPVTNQCTIDHGIKKPLIITDSSNKKRYQGGLDFPFSTLLSWEILKLNENDMHVYGCQKINNSNKCILCDDFSLLSMSQNF